MFTATSISYIEVIKGLLKIIVEVITVFATSAIGITVLFTTLSHVRFTVKNVLVGE